MGKSAILDILLFAIYDQFPRKGGTKDILNNRKRFSYSIRNTNRSSHLSIIKTGKRNTTGSGVNVISQDGILFQGTEQLNRIQVRN